MTGEAQLGEGMRGRRWAVREDPTRDGFPEVPGVFVADTPARCRQALAQMATWDVVGVDVEAYGFNIKREHPKGLAKAISIQFASDTGDMIFVPLWGGRAHLLQAFKSFLEDETPRLVLHNGNFDFHVVANYCVACKGLLGDTLVMDNLYSNGEMLHGLKECNRRYFNDDTAKDFSEVFKVPKPLKMRGTDGEIRLSKLFYVPGLDEVVRSPEGVRKLIEYSCKDPRYTVKLYRFLREKMKATHWRGDSNYLDYYETFERPFQHALFAMEREGCPVDVSHLERARVAIEAELVGVEKRFLKGCVEAGVPQNYMAAFNLRAGAQVADLLYGRLGVSCGAVTGGGKPSVSRETLDDVTGPHAVLAQLVLEHRRLSKLHGTYIVRMIELAPKYGGRLHSTFKQTGARTSRLSSSNPNLQNIVTKAKDSFGVRRAFVAPEGYVVGDIDLSQIELRGMAHYSQCDVLLTMLRGGYDQHITAMRVLDPRVDAVIAARPCKKEVVEDDLKVALGVNVYDDLRRRAKVLNFGCGYGMGGSGYAAKVGCSKEEGDIAVARYWAGFPGLRDLVKKVRAACRERGYIRSLIGRYSVIPNIRSKVPSLRAEAERQSFNYLIQGFVADMIKMSMILVHRCEKLRALGVRLVLQVHDELLLLIPKGAEAKAKPLLEEYVSHPYRFFGFGDLTLDTPATLGIGVNWDEAK